MVVAMLADEVIKTEILAKGYSDNVEVIWADTLQSLRIIEADAYFDLLFENDGERNAQLKFLLPKPLFVNAVIPTSRELPTGFVRINAWPTMIGRKVIEISFVESSEKSSVKKVFDGLGWAFQQVPDVAGMITPRIVSMIINEAWYALAENVSSREEIDTAMKLGTNYPYGPFEWAGRIGAERIRSLLQELQKTNARYTVAPGLEGEFIWR